MAAIGSAVGLGNVWRFPYVCYENGGGAFLIPYFVALFTAGIPLMILEFSIGHKTRRAPPECFRKIGKKWEWAGWLSVLLPFSVAIYYIVIMSWCFSYMVYSIDLKWGLSADSFFKSFLGDTGNPAIFGNISIPVIIGLIALWLIVFIILYKGVKRIGKVVALTVPIPTILLIILAIRGVTLPGAIEGISYYLTPNFTSLTNVNVWLAAYGQIFFSIGVAQGIMITYASFLKKKSDISNNAFIIALADAGTSFLAGFTVFSVVGYLAATNGIGIQSLGDQIAGPNLTFVTYPTAISLLPFAAAFFGAIFFIALLTFGIDSAFSMIEPISQSINDKWNINKAKIVGMICILGFILSLLFTMGNGLHLIDIFDHHIANFGLVIIGLIECFLFGWYFGVEKLRDHANKTSDIKIGRWWDFLIKYVIPIVLSIILVLSIIDSIATPYMNYPWYILIIFGLIPVIILFLFSYILANIKLKRRVT